MRLSAQQSFVEIRVSAKFFLGICAHQACWCKRSRSLGWNWSCGGESVALASLFGVVCAVTRRTVKPSEVTCFRWLIDINDLKIDLGSEREQLLNSPTILPSEKATILSVHFLLLAWNRQNVLSSRVGKKKTLS